MKKDDRVYIQDIQQFIKDIESHLGTMMFAEFGADLKTQDAVIRKLELIGEAASKVSAEYMNGYPEFPHRDVIDLRNLLIHGYDQIDLEKVWNIIENDLPVLKKQVRQMLEAWNLVS